MQRLQNHAGSGIVTIPKDDRARDGLLEDGAIPDSQMADVYRADERTYIARFPKLNGAAGVDHTPNEARRFTDGEVEGRGVGLFAAKGDRRGEGPKVPQQMECRPYPTTHPRLTACTGKD